MISVTQKNTAPNDEPTLGLGGWYYHTGNETIGPLSDAQIISIGQQRPDSGEAVFSRPGFRRWYRYPELSTMLHLGAPQKSSATLLTNLAESVKKLEGLVLADQRQETPMTSEGMHQGPSGQNKRKPTIEPLKKPLRTPPAELDNISAMLAEQTIQRSTTLDRELPSSEELSKQPSGQCPADSTPHPAMNHSSPDIGAQSDPQTIQRSSPNNQSSSDIQTGPSPSNLIQKSAAHIFATPDIMTLRGRLRLGMKRSPMVESLVYGMLTCGLSYSAWYRKVAQELNFHVFNSYKAMSLESLLVLVPVLNSYSFYQIAKLMKRAEAENNYNTTSTWLAVLLGLLPPLGVAYLQNKANEHWDLHVRAAQ
jgi:hypothetical protein